MALRYKDLVLTAAELEVVELFERMIDDDLRKQTAGQPLYTAFVPLRQLSDSDLRIDRVKAELTFRYCRGAYWKKVEWFDTAEERNVYLEPETD